ncbi:hypothetical protein SPFL3101_02831 [Sporomusaceae bacterium FL31]|nr:hypothetical protein SPFL3101_02831 [Sporomusaceae bacterium FL31]
MNSNIYPRCQCCGEVPEYGLYDGIRVNGVLFCRACSQEIVRNVPGDSSYQRFFRTLRKALFPIHNTKLQNKHFSVWSTPKI